MGKERNLWQKIFSISLKEAWHIFREIQGDHRQENRCLLLFCFPSYSFTFNYSFLTAVSVSSSYIILE